MTQVQVPEIQPMMMPTLGTMIPQTYDFQHVLPTSVIQNWNNIDVQGPRANIRGFPTQYFNSTLGEFSASREMPNYSELKQQNLAGVPKYSYRSFGNTNSGPTNFNWSTEPMTNLNKSVNTIPYRDGTSSWVNQRPSRSENRTTMGRETMIANSRLRSQRLY